MVRLIEILYFHYSMRTIIPSHARQTCKLSKKLQGKMYLLIVELFSFPMKDDDLSSLE